MSAFNRQFNTKKEHRPTFMTWNNVTHISFPKNHAYTPDMCRAAFISLYGKSIGVGTSRYMELWRLNKATTTDPLAQRACEITLTIYQSGKFSIRISPGTNQATEMVKSWRRAK